MTDFINPSGSNKNIAQLVKELTGRDGVDYSFECTGKMNLINEAFIYDYMRDQGKGMLTLVGAGKNTPLQIDFMTVIAGRTMKGSIFGGIKVQSDNPVIKENV